MSGTESDDTVNCVLDPELIIIEVEKRPALFDKRLKEYSDRNIKEKLWGEVCVNVIRNWSELSAKEKKSVVINSLCNC